MDLNSLETLIPHIASVILLTNAQSNYALLHWIKGLLVQMKSKSSPPALTPPLQHSPTFILFRYKMLWPPAPDQNPR